MPPLAFMVSLVGPRAMIGYKLRQAWKGATVVADSCAVVWLTGAATIIPDALDDGKIDCMILSQTAVD